MILTLGEIRECVHDIDTYARAQVSTPETIAIRKLTKFIAMRLTNKIIQHDKKSRAALEDLFRYTDHVIDKHKIARRDGGDFCIEFADGESALTVLFDLALHVETCKRAGVDALAPTQEKK